MLRRKKKPVITRQEPWMIVKYSDIQIINKGSEECESDLGYMEFNHKQTGIKIYKEMAWLRGEGPYEYEGYNVPTLPSIWKWLINMTPGTTGFIYGKWKIIKHLGCFIYSLYDVSEQEPKEVYKNIIGEDISCKGDFASFIEMLENIEHNMQEKKPKITIFDLAEMRDKKNALN